MIHIKKPFWIRKNLNINENYKFIRNVIKENNLHTVCEEAICPNLNECWANRTATLIILGDICTRSCRFCSVKRGKPKVYDKNEPIRVASAVKMMGLKHVVITSVDRDDLKLFGSDIWEKTILEIRKTNPFTRIESLIPDFKGNDKALEIVFGARPNILGHNLEMPKEFYKTIRPQSSYDRSLNVLKKAKKYNLTTKTGIMVGLGETFEQIIEVMKDAKEANVDIFTLGQYLQPTKTNVPVTRYLEPKEFEEFKQIGKNIGFKVIQSGPLVRSSYHAHEIVV
jgi:lipoic acid synthetase